MAYRKIEDSKLSAIANSIRSKLGTTVTMKPGEMPGLIDSIGIGVVPSYWASYLASKATEINNALTTAGENKSAFLWYTDVHWSTNYGMSPMILKYLSKNTGMKKTFFGGDIAVEKSGEIASMTAWLEQVRDIPNHHSVIGNHDAQVTELPTAPERAAFFIEPERTGDMSMGTDATNGKNYYYIDNHIENTRYICLSTGKMWTHADELQWCIDALNNTPKGWHIVVISHLWLSNDYSSGASIITTPENYTKVYLDLFDAYNYRESGTASMHSLTYNFANAMGKVEFVIGGHCHQDYDFKTTKGIPVILTECDSWQERDDVSVATKGTTTENCVYAIVADYSAKAVKIINVGRGDTRNVKIPDVVTYTNVIPLAVDNTGAIYNASGTPGYKANIRLSGDSEVTANGWATTGFIKCKKGDVFRFRNMEFFDIAGDGGSTSRCGILWYKSDFTKISNVSGTNANILSSISGWSPVTGANGDLVQFTLNTSSSSTAYIRITVGRIDADSVITINEEID